MLSLEPSTLDHKFIALLKFAAEHDEFTPREISDALDISIEQVGSGTRFRLANIAATFKGYTSSEDEADRKWSMTYEAFLNYLEYVELQDARKSSEQARTYSLWAIGISAGLAVASVAISLYQLNTSSIVVIENKQIEQLTTPVIAAKDEIERLTSRISDLKNDKLLALLVESLYRSLFPVTVDFPSPLARTENPWGKCLACMRAVICLVQDQGTYFDKWGKCSQP